MSLQTGDSGPVLRGGFSASGSVSSPAAGAVVAALASGALWWVSNGNSATQSVNPSNLPAGQYDVRVRVSAVANISNNLELWVGGTKISGLKVGVSQGPPGAAAKGQLIDNFFSRVTLDGASGILVQVALA